MPTDRPRPPAVPPAPPGPPRNALIPSDLGRAARDIRVWVAAEPKPAREAERLVPANPNDAQHNRRVCYVVNFVLRQAGAVPGRDYSPARWQALAERALWTLTALRQSDPRIGTSESLVLRDAQRYLYGTLGDAWLQRHVARHYGVPPELARQVPGPAIDRAYEDVVKPGAIGYNAAAEELTGRNPGVGRGRPTMPHARPGGQAWYDRGQAERERANLPGGPAPAPFLRTVPASPVPPAPTAAELAAPPGHVDLGHGESVNLDTGRYTPGYGPKY